MLKVATIFSNALKESQSLPSLYINVNDSVAEDFSRDHFTIFSMMLALISGVRAIKVKSSEWDRNSKEALFFKAIHEIKQKQHRSHLAAENSLIVVN